MRIPEDTINSIRDQANLVDIVSDYVQVKKHGANYFASCPFHEDASPSLSIQEEKQFFYCFSCGRGGNVFTFIQEIEGMTFPEAVVKVADLIDYPLDPQYSEVQANLSVERGSLSQQLIRLHEEASLFYQQVLTQTDIGKDALNYLHERGLSDETIQQFQLGYSPSQRTALYEYLRGKLKELSPDLLRQSALFIETDSGEFLDRFYQRIIYPIKNMQGECIAFSGRYTNFSKDSFFKDERPQAKYVNSSDTPIFNKSDTLFNLHLARPIIRRQDEIYLFEGYMDVISSYQAGIENGVASMGTSLTDSQINQISKLTNKLVLAYDGDEAGQEASYRAIELLKDKSFDIELVPFPKGSDPDDYIKSRGCDSYRDLLEHGRLTPMGFYQNYFRNKKNLSNESDLLDYINQLLEKMIDVPSALEREMYLKQLAEEFDFSFQTLKAQLDELLDHHRQNQLQGQYQTQKKASRFSPSSEQIELKTTQPYERAENIILHRLFHYPDETFLLLSQQEAFAFISQSAEMMALAFQEFRSKSHSTSTVLFMDFLHEKKLKERLAQIEMMTLAPDYNEEEILECVSYLKDKGLYERLKELQDDMDRVARLGDIDEQKRCLHEIIELSKQIEASH